MGRTRSIQENKNDPGATVTAGAAAQSQACSECVTCLTKGLCEMAREREKKSAQCFRMRCTEIALRLCSDGRTREEPETCSGFSSVVADKCI